MMSTDNKPSNQEEEYFKREDAERLRKLHAEEQARMQKSEREVLKRQYGGRSQAHQGFASWNFQRAILFCLKWVPYEASASRPAASFIIHSD